MNQVLHEIERLLEQVISKDIVNIIVHFSVDNSYMNVHECDKCLKLETELQTGFIEKEIYDKLFRSYTILEKHCISLEVDSQLNQEIFQRDNSVSNQSAPSFDQYFELNELKAQSQEKDTVIKKLKERINSLSGKVNDDKIKKDLEEIETINIEVDHRVSKLIAKNEHLKQTYKQLYDLIKPAHIRSKEQSLKNELRKLKGKTVVDTAVMKHTIDLEMLKIDVEPITPKLYTKRIQDFLSYISKTCPSINNSGEKLVAVTPKNKDKRVKFSEPVTSSGNTRTTSSSNIVSNKPALSSTGVRPSTSASGSQPSGNTKKDKILQPSSSTLKNKVEAHPRKVKSKKFKEKSLEPTGKVFTNIGYIWRPTGQTFTIVGTACPLTRITTTAEVPPRKPTALKIDTPKPVTTLVYSRKPRKSKVDVPVSKPKILKSVIQIVLWYLDSGCSKHMTGDRSQLTNFVYKFLGTVKFRNDHKAKIMGYGDYQIRNVTISRVYYVEGLGHNLFFVGQFCDSNLEVAFHHHICFIRNLEGVDLLTGSQARHSLVRGLPKLKFEKDHLYYACAMGKSKKKPHKPKSEDTKQEKLYLLYMDLYGPMRVASVNGKKYILVIVDDYSRFTWVKCLRSKDEAPDFIIKFLKMIQVLLKTPVRRIKTDNGTEFVNQTLREYYEKVGIFHETFVARSP
ncbi:retrovirus-related pol polyprotein from transposon TNT 1-94 [Tanacetum coccineum]